MKMKKKKTKENKPSSMQNLKINVWNQKKREIERAQQLTKFCSQKFNETLRHFQAGEITDFWMGMNGIKLIYIFISENILL